jgi:hypothetical protein
MWGDASVSKTILVNGYPFSVTANLEAGLWTLVQSFGILNLWADAVCINQNDNAERSQQVQKMRAIYEQAQKVDIYINDVLGYQYEAFNLLDDILRYMKGRITSDFIFAGHGRRRELLALQDFFRNGYWLRVWITQEVAVARDALVFFGSRRIQLEDLLAIQKSLCDDLWDEIYRLSNFDPSISANTLRGGGPGRLALPPKTLPLPDLYDVLEKHVDKLSTDPRDQVFAIVGLTKARESPDMTPNYALSVEQVFYNTTRYILLSSKSLDIIHLQPREDCPFALPSWVPDYSLGARGNMQPFHGFHGSVVTYQASWERNARFSLKRDNRSLIVRGLCLATIKHVSDDIPMTGPRDEKGMLLQFHAWRKLLSQVKGDGEDVRLSFCRTLMLDGWGDWKKILAALAKLSRENNLHPNDAQLESFENYAESIDYTTKAWIETIRLAVCHRSFFISADSSKIIGLGPDTLAEGDSVCILLGCSVPVVLRRVGDYFIYLGEAYVDEYMKGAGIQELEEGTHSLQDFELR